MIPVERGKFNLNLYKKRGSFLEGVRSLKS